MMKTVSAAYPDLDLENQNNKRFKYSNPAIDCNNSMSSSSGSISSPPMSPVSSLSQITPYSVPTNPLGPNANKLNKIVDFSNSYNSNAAMMNRNYFCGTNSANTAAQQINYLQCNNSYENYNPFSLLQQSQHLNHYAQVFQQQQLNMQNSCSSTSSSSTRSSFGSNQNLNSPNENTAPVMSNQRQQSYGYNMNSNAKQNNEIANSVVCQSNENNNGSLPLKKRRAVPVENKDPGYWEKRKKNNESAKRSRDNRRVKEDHLAMKNMILEQENLQLKTQVALYEAEIEKLRAMAYGLGNSH